MGSGSLPSDAIFVLGIWQLGLTEGFLNLTVWDSEGRMLCCYKVKGRKKHGWIGSCCRDVEINLGMAGTSLLRASKVEVFL